MRGGKLEAGNVKLKRGRLDTLPPRTVLDINQLVDAISLRDLSPDQPIQLTQFRQAWRVKAGQRVNVIATGKRLKITRPLPINKQQMIKAPSMRNKP
ncbi:flagellar basal body P-ring formation chaperone FlgA [Escherichia marmotae]|nr:flagellar basal body P-ring formation chaperone FlgA [Escherichia marmotae]